MATIPTNNPVPSESPRDLKFNAGKFDEFVTSMGWQYTDRFGVKHYTVEGLRWIAQQAISAFGYITLKSFQLGAPLPNNELTLPNQILRDDTDGEYYRWDGALPKIVPAGSSPQTTGGIGKGAWLSVGDASLRQELASTSGDKIVSSEKVKANGNNSLKDVIDRIFTYSDMGKPQPIDGFDIEFYQEVFDSRANDCELYLPGKLNISDDLYGTSNSAALMSLNGNNNDSFRAQVVSGDTETLSRYNMSEDLLLYGGIFGKSSVSTINPTYTEDSITITDSAPLDKVRRGSVIKTMDNYWGKAVSVYDNKITVDGWYSKGVKGTPSGTTAYLNQIDKTYFSNLVMWIPESYTGTKVVGSEWDFMIANPNVTEKNGLDLVIHQSSKFDMDAAFYIRSAIAGRSWATGMVVADFTYAALETRRGTGDVQAAQDLLLRSGSTRGIVFNGNGGDAVKTSMTWRFSSESAVYPTQKNRYGFDISRGDVSLGAQNGVAITLDASFYYVNNQSSFSLILPSQNLVPGQKISFGISGVGEMTITCRSSSVLVNNSPSYVFTPSKKYTQGEAVWDGTSWWFYS